MKKVAILVDGGYVQKRISRVIGRPSTAEDIISLAISTLVQGEGLFRIYYYGCPPYDRVEVNPLSKERVDFNQTDVCQRQKHTQSALSQMEYFACRKGVVQFTGWKIRSGVIKELAGRTCNPTDLIPDITQKHVDMKIGLDVAWLASRQIVDRIILIAMIPISSPPSNSPSGRAYKSSWSRSIPILIAILWNTPTRSAPWTWKNRFR